MKFVWYNVQVIQISYQTTIHCLVYVCPTERHIKFEITPKKKKSSWNGQFLPISSSPPELAKWQFDLNSVMYTMSEVYSLSKNRNKSSSFISQKHIWSPQTTERHTWVFCSDHLLWLPLVNKSSVKMKLKKNYPLLFIYLYFGYILTIISMDSIHQTVVKRPNNLL